VYSKARVWHGFFIPFIGTSFLLLTLLGISLVGGLLAIEIHKKIFKNLEINVYLADGLREDYLSNLKKILKSLGGVEKVEFISKKRAKKIFEKNYPDYAELLELFPESPFPESFRLVLKPYMTKEKWISELAEKISMIGGVEEVYYPANVLSRAEKWLRILLLSTFSLILFVLFAVTFIISQMVRMNRTQISSPLKGIPFLLSNFSMGFLAGIFSLFPNLIFLLLIKQMLAITLNSKILLVLPAYGGLLGVLSGYLSAGK
jgi:hypothetical protein